MLISAALSLLITGVATSGGLWIIIRFLERQQILDQPNDRSSHSHPTPRGAGLALIPAILAVWAAIAWDPTAWFGNELVSGMEWIIGAAVLLAAISWVDDLRGLSPIIRLIAQGAAISVALWAVPLPGALFQGLLPPWLDLAIAGLFWLWFVNLFNFMDGIDGISAVESMAISVGIFAVLFIVPGSDALALMAAAVAGGTFTFLRWNWSPAKIFLGDVGSVPLGFLLGWLLLRLAAEGQWAPAVILPSYYLADATVTLLRRARRREKIWQAHRQHFYQHAVQNGLSHAEASKWVAYANVGLIACAGLAAAGWPIAGIGIAVVVVTTLLIFFGRQTTGKMAISP